MKKHLFSFAALIAAAVLFVACETDENGNLIPNTYTVDYTDAVYIVNSGNMYNGINGSLTRHHTLAQTTDQDIFERVNGRSLGATPNDAVVYGTKLYIAVDGENTIEVCDASTAESLTAISTVELLGENGGKSPRHLLALDGKIYVSTYGGVVAAIDTTTYALSKKYTVGAYPEGMAFADGKIYVANSSYGDGTAPSLSIINLATGNVETLTDEAIKNPSTVLALNGAIYVMEGDLYDWNTWEVISAGGLRKVTGTTVDHIYDSGMAMGSNQMAAYKDKIYMIKDAYTAPVCLIYDTTDGTTTELPLQGLVAANAINIEPNSGDIYVLSYAQSAEVSEYTQADYNAPGFCNRYNNAGELITTFSVGVGPTAICFKPSVMEVTISPAEQN